MSRRFRVVGVCPERQKCGIGILILPSPASWQFLPSALAIRAGLSAQRVSELHRSSYPDAAVCRAFVSSFDQLRIGDPLAVRRGEQRIDAIAFLGVAAIVAPGEL